MQCYAKLTSPCAVLTSSTGGTLLHSADLGDTSGTRQAGGTVPHPALERGKDENPELFLGDHTEHTKVGNVVVGSPDAPSKGSNLNVVNVVKTKNPTQASKTSKWCRRKANRTSQKLQNWRERKIISKSILENLEQQLRATEVCVELNPS